MSLPLRSLSRHGKCPNFYLSWIVRFCPFLFKKTFFKSEFHYIKFYNLHESKERKFVIETYIIKYFTQVFVRGRISPDQENLPSLPHAGHINYIKRNSEHLLSKLHKLILNINEGIYGRMEILHSRVRLSLKLLNFI